MNSENKTTLNLHVGTHGNDAWSGTLPEPNATGTDGPLATPQAARDRLRARRKAGEAGPFTVLLRGGTYFLDETIEFGPEDSGGADAPVVFAAWPGERPVLSGGRRITGWRAGEINGHACWTADLPEVKGGGWFFTQLFVNGSRRSRPRFPKTGYHHFTGVPDDTDAGTFAEWETGPDAAVFRPGDIRPWKNLADVKVLILRLWFEMHQRIRALEPERNIVRFGAKCPGGFRDEKQAFPRYFVENVSEAMSEPGEWYLDRAEGRIHYLPLPGETPEAAEVIAPRLEVLARFGGSDQTPVSHVRLENLVLAHAEWDYPGDDAGSIQAAFKVPGAVQFDRAEHCVLYGCEIAHVAQYGVEVMAGSHANCVAGCTLHDLGAGGVRINNEWAPDVSVCAATHHRVIDPSLAEVSGRADRRPLATTVADCTVHDGGKIHLSAIGIYVANSGGNRILHNHIFDLNYTGISCGWTWGYRETATVDNRIEFNHIHHINWNRVLSDNGGIYTLGPHPGGTLRGNHIHHISCFGYGGWGIYLDAGSSEFLIEDNIVHHTRHAGFFTNFGRENLLRNNLFALSEEAHVSPGTPEAHRSTLFERNIVFWRRGSITNAEWQRGNYLFRDNLFWNESGPVEFGDFGSLEQVRHGGQHDGSLVADPLFECPDAGEFSLRTDSPAITQLGFKPIDAGLAGPRFGGSRPVTFAAWLSLQKAEKPRAIVRTRLEKAGEGVVRLTVSNVGQVAATGRVRLKGWPSEALRLARGGRSYAFADLAPGESRSAEFAFRVDPEAEQAAIETEPVGGGLHPAALLMEPRRDRLKTQPPPSATVPRRPAPAGDDMVQADWNLAARLGGWRSFSALGPEVPTEARVFHDGQRLYLRLHAEMKTANICSEEVIAFGDYWDIFFAAGRARPFRQLMVAPDARISTLTYGEPRESWECPAPVSVVRPDSWTVYLAIPLRQLVAEGRSLEPGGVIYANFFRGSNGRFFAWSPTFTLGNANPDRMGELRMEP